MSEVVRAARRHDWWADPPGRPEVYHVVVDGHAACNQAHPTRAARMPLAPQTERDAADVPVEQRCRRSGCRVRWPELDNRATSG